MASLFTSSSHPSLFSQNPNRKIPNLRRFSAPQNPTLLYSPRIPNPRRLSPLSSSPKPDPPIDDDEWGREPSSSLIGKITDEWGEKSDPEPEPPSQPDPAVDEDEWGREEAGSGNGSASGGFEPEPDPESDKKNRLGDLKRCLADTLYGTEYGLRASGEVRAEILELVSQLEAENPTPAPNAATELLDGNWVLLYTAFSELLPLVAIGTIPLLKVKKISQAIDTKSMTIINATTLSSPFATLSFSATASFEVRSPSRIQDHLPNSSLLCPFCKDLYPKCRKVQFKEGAFQPPEISSTLNLPENIEIFGQKINLSPIQQSLNPLQEAVANIACSISGQPPLKFPIPGERAASWLLTTYLDEDFRISRGDGGLFVLAKEGSPLIDQLS